MSNVQQISEDLHFVREAVARRGRPSKGPAAIYCIWAAYVLIGYALIDFARPASGWFFLIGGILGGMLSWWIGRGWGMRTGEWDKEMARRAMLHWAGGIVLAIIVSLALSSVIPSLREGSASGQLIVVLIGMVYFLAGVHFDRHFLWLGPLLMAGGVVVGFFPRYGWTGLGAVIAAALVITAILPAQKRNPSP